MSSQKSPQPAGQQAVAPQKKAPTPSPAGPQQSDMPAVASADAQAEMLQQMPAAQGQAMLSRMGQAQGNRHVQRVVSGLTVQRSPAKKSPQEEVMDRVRQYDTYIAEASKLYGIEVNKIRAIIATESAGKPEASSGAAFGLMQITKGTWEGTRQHKSFPELKGYEFSESNWKDPRINILMGTAVFKLKMQAVGIQSTDEGSAELAVIAYNAGEGTVKHAINNAKAGGSTKPTADCLKPEYLKPAIKTTKIYTYYLTGNGKKNNPYVNGTQKYDEAAAISYAVDLKYNEVSRYPTKIREYLAVQEKGASDKTPVEQPPKTTGGATTTAEPTISYTVQSGEGLNALATKLGVSVDVIKEYNRAKLKKWGSVEGFVVGEVIVVPAAQAKPKETQTEQQKSDPAAKGATPERVDMGKRKDGNRAYMLDWDNTHNQINQSKTLREAFKGKLATQLEDFFGKKITVEEVLQSIQAAESAGDAAKAEELRAKLFKANQYAVVETLDVENSKRYEKLMEGGATKATYCNIYAYDVVSALGGYLPRVWWTDDALKKVKAGQAVKPKYGETIREMNANSLNAWMGSEGGSFGWRKADGETAAQNAANSGRLVILLAANANPRRSGHVSVVMAEKGDHKAKRTGDNVTVPLQSQAGGTNYKYDARGAWWKDANHTQGAAWIFEGKAESSLLTPEQLGAAPAPGDKAQEKTAGASTEKPTGVTTTPKSQPQTGAQTEAQTGTQSAQMTTYKVQPGESLPALSTKLGVSIEALKAANLDQLQQWKTRTGVVEGFNAGAVIRVPSQAQATKAEVKQNNGTDEKGGSKFSFWGAVSEGLSAVGKFVKGLFGGLFGGSEATAQTGTAQSGATRQSPEGAWSLTGAEKRALDALMAQERLEATQIAQARALITKIDDDKVRGDFYEALQSKVIYANQRDNASTEGGKAIGDVMCNVTSLAMALQYLGVKNPYPEMQYEDALEKIRRDKGLGPRTYMETGWGKIAEEMGATYKNLGGGVRDKKWYKDNVLKAVRSGEAVMMSIQGHIVRLQNVTEGGLEVDDPYGKVNLQKRKDKGYSGGWEEYNKRPGGGGPKDNAGEDVVWPWSHVESYDMRWIATLKKG